MIPTVLFAALTLAAAPVQSSPQTPPASSNLPNVEVEGERAEPTTRRVCRFETQIGSNRRTRVCRDVPRQGQQDQATREFMRDSQRVRMPDT